MVPPLQMTGLDQFEHVHSVNMGLEQRNRKPR
jgi:hypothetical protein